MPCLARCRIAAGGSSPRAPAVRKQFPGLDLLPQLIASGSRLLAVAAAAYLGRYRGQSRIHTDSDLRVFLRPQTLNPLQAAQTDIECYVR